MHLSVTFDVLGHRNLSKCIESKWQAYKLLGSCVRLEVNSESLRVKHSIYIGGVLCQVYSIYFYVQQDCRSVKIE